MSEISPVDSNPSILFSDSVIKYFIDEVVKFITGLKDSDGLLQKYEKKLLENKILNIISTTQ
ncbi:MAG: hypothetical protein IPO37_22025 [Saprospiraceae bacterium]|nr:hypothetical protein [Saprospiraceae bacterium]